MKAELIALLNRTEEEIKGIQDFLSKKEKNINTENNVREKLSNPANMEKYIKDLENLANTLSILISRINNEIFHYR